MCASRLESRDGPRIDVSHRPVASVALSKRACEVTKNVTPRPMLTDSVRLHG